VKYAGAAILKCTTTIIQSHLKSGGFANGIMDIYTTHYHSNIARAAIPARLSL
jgi:hypothetical protein